MRFFPYLAQGAVGEIYIKSARALVARSLAISSIVSLSLSCSKERTKETVPPPPPTYFFSVEAMNDGVGRKSGSSPPASQLLRLHPPVLFPLLELPELQLGRLASRLLLSRDQSSHIRGREEVWCRLAASPIGNEVLDHPPAPLPPTFLKHLFRQDLPLASTRETP